MANLSDLGGGLRGYSAAQSLGVARDAVQARFDASKMARQEQEQLIEDAARFAQGVQNEQQWEAGRQDWAARGYDIGPFAHRNLIIQRAVPVVEKLRMDRQAAESARAQSNADRAYGLQEREFNANQDYRKQNLDFEREKFTAKNGTGGVNFDDEAKLRGEYLKGSGDFMTVRDAYGRLQAAAKDDTNAGHIATVYAFMKMLDPGSVVRESEYATAENAAGVPDTIRNLWNRVLDGQRLPDSLRANILQQGQRQFDAATSRHKAYSDSYRGLSGKYGFDPERITPDLSGGVQAERVAPGAGTVIDGYTIKPR